MVLTLERLKYVDETPHEQGKPGQDWAAAINKNFTLIDEHNHEIGKGVILASENLGSGEFDVNDYALKKIWALDFLKISDANVVDKQSLFVSSTDNLSYKNDNGDVVQITKGSTLNPDLLPKAFTVLSGNPLCTYEPTTNTFVFKETTSPNSLQNVRSYSALFDDIKANEINFTSLIIEDIYLPFAQKLCFFEDTQTVLQYKNLTHCLYKLTGSNDIYCKAAKQNVLYMEADGVSNDASYFLGARHFVAKDTSTQDELPLGMEYKVNDVSFDLVNNEDTSERVLDIGFTQIIDEEGKQLLGVIPIFSLVSAGNNFIDPSSFKDENIKNVYMAFFLQEGQLRVKNNYKFYNFPPLKVTYRVVYSERFVTEF